MCRLEQVVRAHFRIDIAHSMAVQIDNIEHWLAIKFESVKRTRRAGQLGADGISGAGHNGGNRPGQCAGLIAVVRQSKRHNQRTKIRIAQPKRTKLV